MQTIFLQAASGGLPLHNIFLFGAIILVAYFFMIRPQQKKVKEQKKFREELTKGMDVITIGGLHGKIIAVEGDIVVLEVDKGIRLTFDKASISMEASTKVK